MNPLISQQQCRPPLAWPRNAKARDPPRWRPPLGGRDDPAIMVLACRLPLQPRRSAPGSAVHFQTIAMGLDGWMRVAALAWGAGPAWNLRGPFPPPLGFRLTTGRWLRAVLNGRLHACSCCLQKATTGRCLVGRCRVTRIVGVYYPSRSHDRHVVWQLGARSGLICFAIKQKNCP